MSQYATLFLDWLCKFVSFMFAFDFGLGFSFGHFLVVCFILGIIFRNVILKLRG